jgi:arginine N-succinyltransferase
MLLTEGFRDEGYVDIFDGGPTLVAPIDKVATIAARRIVTYLGEKPGGTPALIATGHAKDFRLVRGGVSFDDGGLWLDPGAARSLGVSSGETLQVAPAEARVQ